MPSTENFGIFFDMEVERDDQGFIEIPVIIRASGSLFGAAPAEFRIHTAGAPHRAELLKTYCAELNRTTSGLPFYLATAKVKIVSNLQKVTDEQLVAEGLEPLAD